MHFNDPEVDLPAKRVSMDPEQNKNPDFTVQATLMDRSPEGHEAWVMRHAAKFRELFTKDEGFRELVNGERTNENLQAIQARLNEEDDLH